MSHALPGRLLYLEFYLKCQFKVHQQQKFKFSASVFVCLPIALYSIHKKKVYGAKLMESQNLQTLKSKYVVI